MYGEIKKRVNGDSYELQVPDTRGNLFCMPVRGGRREDMCFNYSLQSHVGG